MDKVVCGGGGCIHIKHTYNGILVSNKKGGNSTICDNMDRPGRHVSQRKTNSIQYHLCVASK